MPSPYQCRAGIGRNIDLVGRDVIRGGVVDEPDLIINVQFHRAVLPRRRARY